MTQTNVILALVKPIVNICPDMSALSTSLYSSSNIIH